MSTVRAAVEADIPEIVRIVNLANEVEHFFVDGDRTNEADVRGLLFDTAFLVVEEEARLLASVHCRLSGEVGHFGMLAVEPVLQGSGLGRRLVDAAEAFFVARGAGSSELEFVSVRPELQGYYERLGYRVTGTAPYVEWREAKMPVHFVIMRKPLASAPQQGD